MIRDWWVSVRFVCFVFQGLLLCDRPVLGNNRLVKFASQIFLIFLILVTCKNKAMSASFLQQKIYTPPRFPSLFLNSLEFDQAGRARYNVICINPPFTKVIDGTKKTKISSKFAICAGWYNKFRCNMSTNQNSWPDLAQILCHRDGISVVEAQMSLQWNFPWGKEKGERNCKGFLQGHRKTSVMRCKPQARLSGVTRLSIFNEIQIIKWPGVWKVTLILKIPFTEYYLLMRPTLSTKQS